EAQLAEGEGLPGQVVVKTKKSLVIATGQGALSLIVVQPAGKPKMSIIDFLNGIGRKLEVGDIIGR
ncbi:TPA: methionyl-tRNA formyltransferase, partial [Streptococcus pyogenes]